MYLLAGSAEEKKVDFIGADEMSSHKEYFVAAR
jgi:hypothetical protein